MNNSVRRRKARESAFIARNHAMGRTRPPKTGHEHVLVCLQAGTISTKGTPMPDKVTGYACATCPELFTENFTPSRIGSADYGVMDGTQMRRHRRKVARQSLLARGDKKKVDTEGDELASKIKERQFRSTAHLRRVFSRDELAKRLRAAEDAVA